MKTQILSAAAALGVLSALLVLPARPARAQVVFQAAGPTAAAIQGSVDAYRAALGDPNNGSILAGQASGRREINWDGGGGVSPTTAPGTPFDVFLNNRAAQFTTPGI